MQRHYHYLVCFRVPENIKTQFLREELIFLVSQYAADHLILSEWSFLLYMNEEDLKFTQEECMRELVNSIQSSYHGVEVITVPIRLEDTSLFASKNVGSWLGLEKTC